MPKMARWLLAIVDQEGGGVQSVAARSLPDDGSSWSSLWPWQAHGWEMPTVVTTGLLDGLATWVPADGRVSIQLASPPVTIAGDPTEVPLPLCGLYEPRGMVHGRVYYVQHLEDISLENSVGPKCLWYAEDRGQWVLTDPTGLGTSATVLARVKSRAWWPWEAHLSSTTSPASLGAAPFATLPVWFGGAAVLASARAGWEVADAGGAGTFHKARDMAVTMVCNHQVMVQSSRTASHPFLGTYDHKGLLASRPFFLQVSKLPAADSDSAAELQAPTSMSGERFVLWFADELDQWVITEDFRLLDCVTVDARAADTAWMPWNVFGWEVPDTEPNLRVEALA